MGNVPHRDAVQHLSLMTMHHGLDFIAQVVP